jgi:hypothetical protein
MGVGLPLRGGSLRPPRAEPRRRQKRTPGAGAGAPAARQPTREAMRAAEAPARHGDGWG